MDGLVEVLMQSGSSWVMVWEPLLLLTLSGVVVLLGRCRGLGTGIGVTDVGSAIVGQYL